MAKTILLADDSVTIQKVVELTFMDEDYQVIATGDGTAALEQLPGLGPDLVIADVHMPGADGYEVCRQTKERHPEIPVLLLVGTFEQFDEQRAAAVGADGHLKKPFDSQDLLNQVESLVTRSGSAAAAAPAAGDVFGTEAGQPAVADLEPPPLEAPAPPAGDIWGAPPPAGEPETQAFPASPATDFGDPAPAPDLDQSVAETAAVDLEAVGTDAAGSPPAAEPAFDLEAPPLQAPPIEDFAPFDEEPAIEESAAEEPAAEEPAPWAAAPEPEAAEEPAAEEPAPWAAAPEPEAAEEPAAEEPTPWAAVPEPEPAEEPAAEEPESWAAAPEPEPVEEPAPEGAEAAAEEAAVAELAAAAAEPVATEPAAEPASASAAATNGSGPLNDDDVERIARRVAELMGERALRDIAWEVLPDLAEVIIKERIRELESQVV